jgi:hypothetical protein
MNAKKLLLTALTALTLSASALANGTSDHLLGCTLDQAVDYMGSPVSFHLEHVYGGRNDFGVCDVYTFRWNGDDFYYVAILRHNVGLLKTGTVCSVSALLK